MATVVRKPRSRGPAALGQIFSSLLTGKLAADKREEEERERAEALARTSALLGGRVSGSGVRDERSPTNIMGPLLNRGIAPGAPAPRTVQPGEILRSAIGAGIPEAQAVQLEKLGIEAENRRREEKRRREVAGALRGATRGLDPTDPRASFVQELLSSKAAAEPGMATAALGQTGAIFPTAGKPGKPLSVEVFNASGASKKMRVPAEVADKGEDAIQAWLAERAPKGFTTVEPAAATGAGKPTETQRDVEATRGFLAENNEAFGKLTRSKQSEVARLVLRNQDRARRVLDDKFDVERDAAGGLLSMVEDPMAGLVYSQAQSEILGALADTGGGDPGKAAQVAETKARDTLKDNLPAIAVSMISSADQIEEFMENAINEFKLRPKQAAALRSFLEQRFPE